MTATLPQNQGFFMFFSDEQDNRYWGIGSISRRYRGGSIDIPVRITYLPKTKFVLGADL